MNSDLTLLTVLEKFKFDISWYCLNESLMRSQDYIYDTKTHLALWSRINFSNLARCDQQHLQCDLSAGL